MSEIIPYQDIEKMGTAVAVSGLFGLKTKEQAIALMLVAQALGKHPALAAMEYNIIQGRPAKKAEAIQADFQAAGGKIEWHCLTDEKAEATFTHPSGGSLKLDWTIERAKKANLYDKDGSMYKKYPRQMLKARLVADGVRAVYPAAMGGVRAVEEMDDEGPSGDASKSRVEAIVDAEFKPTNEAKEDVKKDEIEKPKETVKKTRDKDVQVSNEPAVPAEVKLPQGHKIVIGLIDNSLQGDNGEIKCYKTATVNHPETNKPALKHSFLIVTDGVEKRYGTFDQSIADKVMECIDKRILVKFEFKERDTGKSIMNDIVKFSQAVADKNVAVE